jgi:hypothetical protein
VGKKPDEAMANPSGIRCSFVLKQEVKARNETDEEESEYRKGRGGLPKKILERETENHRNYAYEGHLEE